MNLPNKLTILRLILVPFMVVAFYLPYVVSAFIALAIFLIASFTDFLDGYIARRDNLVTDFGKFMDPLADKALVLVALILIVDAKIILMPYIASISLIVMLVRELVISGLRLVGANKGVVIAADKLGKIKTVVQILAISLILLMNALNFYEGFSGTMSYTIIYCASLFTLGFATAISLVSGISYVVKNKSLFKGSK